jgi:uncharacterized membrane protein
MDTIVAVTSVFLAGLLAGEELIVRYGVHPALIALDDVTQVRARQSLIYKMRVLVPVVFFATLAAAVAALLVGGADAGLGFRIAAVAALVIWLGTTFGGTVIVNSAVIEWDPEALPQGWRAMITRWGRIDVVRSSAAIVALACAATGLGLG